MNKKKMVIISSYVDKLIKDLKPDVEFYIFKDISGLTSYLKTEAIRADSLIITRDVLGVAVNNALSILNGTLNEFYLKINKVYYITEENSSELPMVNFLLEEERIDNWEIILGKLTREYVTDFICGNIRAKDITPERRVVLRRKKSEWKREQLKDKAYLDAKYETEEDLLSSVEDVGKVPSITNLDYTTDCKLLTVTGIDSKERTILYSVFAQYLSNNNKVLLIERDYQYHRLSDILGKSNVTCTKIKLSSVFIDINSVLNRIRMSTDKLIVIVVDTREQFNYTFLCNVMYNNLKEDLDYVLMENEFNELSTPDDYLVVIPSDIPSLLKTVDELPTGYKEAARYVMVDIDNIQETKVTNSEAVSILTKDLLNYEEDIYIPIITIDSVELKGHPQELRFLVKEDNYE